MVMILLRYSVGVACRCCENKTGKFQLQLGDCPRRTDLVGAWVCIGAQGVGGLLDVRVVLAAHLSTGEAEDAADAEGGRASPTCCPAQCLALRCSVAGSVVVRRGRGARVVWELHHIEHIQGLE